MISDLETTFQRRKSKQWNPKRDDKLGDIVLVTIRIKENFTIDDFKNCMRYPFDHLQFSMKFTMNKFKIDGVLYKFDFYRHDNEIRIKDDVDGIPDMFIDYNDVYLEVFQDS